MKSITLLVMLAISTNIFSQQNTDYLKKSKNQKKIGFIMLGGGATLLLTGFVIPRGPLDRDGFWPSYKNDGIKQSLGLTGFLSMLGSIPLFIASSKNKKKAASVSFRNEKIQTLQKTSLAYKLVPSVCLTVRL